MSDENHLVESRDRTTQTRSQIFAAMERLLEDVPLHDVSVAQIISKAEVSRATFYFYFSSKYDVIVGLLGQAMDEIFEVARPCIERPDDVPPAEALRSGLEAATKLWSTHRFALRAVSEYWHAIPELRVLWLEVVERFTEAFGAEIDRERASGLAAPGPDSRQLAATLLWATERCFYLAGLGVDDDLPSEEGSVDALLALWRGAIFPLAPAVDAAQRGAPPRRAPSQGRKH